MMDGCWLALVTQGIGWLALIRWDWQACLIPDCGNFVVASSSDSPDGKACGMRAREVVCYIWQDKYWSMGIRSYWNGEGGGGG